MRATGSFEVKMTPQPADDSGADSSFTSPLGRFLLDKQFHGDLEALSKGQMLSAGTAVKGSAGYVAMEQVTGSLHGQSGSFALMHRGIMHRGVPELVISVVPDSGTGDLVGLTGTLGIVIAEGKHTYEFDYTLTTES